MAILTPNWLQNGSYPARYDRLTLQKLFGDRELVFNGLQVTQNGAGAQNVNISLGAACIIGDDQTDQGLYVVLVDANVSAFGSPSFNPPGANKRIDVVSLRINDPQAGGPAGDNASFVVTQGVVSASPAVPATPTSAIALAQVLRTAGDGAVLTAHITDVRPLGMWPYTISTAAVPASLPPNYLYVKVA